MEDTYKPHSYATPITLPSVPPSVSLSATGAGGGLQQWFRGLSSTPVSHFAPEAIKVSEDRWNVKWEHFNRTFQDEVDQASLNDITKDGLIRHLERLESEFSRLKDRFVEIDSTKTTAEVAVGVQFILLLIEEQDPAISELKIAAANSLDEEHLKSFIERVKGVDKVHKFALQSSDTIHRMKVLNMLGSRLGNTSGGTSDSRVVTEKRSQDSLVIGSPINGSSIVPADEDEPMRSPIGQRVQFVAPQDSVYSNNQPAASSLAPARSSPYPPRRRESYDIPEPERRRTGALSQGVLSTAASHRNNLVSLSAVSFFGAGMAWGTVFSGTRGDLVLISWAACCFIVGAISAGSAISLLDVDGELLNRYKPVRWTVRLLAVWSMLHVFVGVMLVSAAILVLDPNADQPMAGIHGANTFGIQDGRAAGGYSLVICALVVIVALVVRYRYSRRTWFV